MTSPQQETFKCVSSGASETTDEQVGRKEEEDCFELKDEVERSALLTAAMLGRSATVREMITNGAQIDEQTVRGYSALHLASCWGHLETVRTLTELGADMQSKTFRGERPVDLARKYSKTDCVDCLILAGVTLWNMCIRVCSDKSDWILSVQHPTVSDFIAQRKDLEDNLQAILSKLTDHCKYLNYCSSELWNKKSNQYRNHLKLKL
ncbi:ankyrin repeat domain-containing protein 45 isoform X2 [Antennarius striatus]|uniref:ankyrin repeat domain-containing protein 45 isoform X2 n=1 Tax=Antennarius striatus TaxID=241820 RepID=UPI0035B4D31C